MRKLGKRVEQKGIGKRVHKKNYELLTDISKSKTKKQIAKELKIAPRTLRSYYDYLRKEIGDKREISKSARKPGKEFTTKLKKLAKKSKVKTTRQGNNVFTRSDERQFKSIVSEQAFKSIKEEMKKDNFFGILIRVNIVFYTKQGVFTDWITLISPVTTKSGLNNFITGEVGKRVRAKNSIIAFEIKEIVFDVTTNEYEKNTTKKGVSKGKAKNIKPPGKSKRPGKNKK